MAWERSWPDRHRGVPAVRRTWLPFHYTMFAFSLMKSKGAGPGESISAAPTCGCCKNKHKGHTSTQHAYHSICTTDMHLKPEPPCATAAIMPRNHRELFLQADQRHAGSGKIVIRMHHTFLHQSSAPKGIPTQARAATAACTIDLNSAEFVGCCHPHGAKLGTVLPNLIPNISHAFTPIS